MIGMKKTTIICRCEDITEDDILSIIHEGYTDLEEIRRKLRIGMGPCQGRVCIQLVKKILERETKKQVQETSLPTNRPPLIPISLGALAAKRKKGEHHEKKS